MQDMLTTVCLDDGQTERVKRKKLADLFVLLAIMVGLVLIFLEPPFVCPDENAHFINICRISHGRLFASVEDGAIGSYITDEEFRFLGTYGGIYNGDDGETYDLDTATRLSNAPASDDLMFVVSHHSTINPIPYILPALIPFLLNSIGVPLNAYNILMLAKLANLLFYVLVIRWAILKTSVLPKTMFMLALMPMAIFQGASASYDASLIASSLLLLAYVSKILCSDEQTQISTEDIVAICFASAFIIGGKIGYVPLVLILFAIPIKKFGSLKRYFFCIGCVAATAVVAYVLPTLINSIITAGCEIPPTDLQLQQKEYVRQNPSILPRMMIDTIVHFAAYWASGFFGILGWLDTNFPNPLVAVFLVLLAFCAIVETASVKQRIHWIARVLSVSGVAIFFICTLLAMYIQWNPILVELVGGTIAYGGQGRYFIPVVLFIPFACSSSLLLKLRIGHKLQQAAEQIVPIVSASYLCLMLVIVLVRYWT